jgi:hypothetical protein
MKGAGVAAALERIRKSFLEVHKDQRTREQRQADEEMIASIQIESAPPQEIETPTLIVENQMKVSTTEKRANAYIGAALRSPHAPKHTAHYRNNVHCGWDIEAPSESADALIQQALRQLGKE